MAEIRLVFDVSDNTPSVRVDYIHPDNSGIIGGKPQPFDFQLTDDDYRDLRWYLEEYMDLPIGGSVLRARRIEQSLVQWGHDLYGAIFDHGDARDLIRDLLRADAPRVLTIAATNGDILRLPWELLADQRGALTRQDVTIRRQLETVKQDLKYTVGSPLRVLLVVSRPDDAGFIDPRHSTRAMLDTLKSLAGNVNVEFCRPPTLARMEAMLAESETPYDIIHFDGHGNYDRLLGLGVLLFEKDQKPGQARVETHTVRADTLGNLLAKYNIPLVILEACRTSQVDELTFRSVAPRLIEAGVGSVVAMSYAVHVEAAKILIERFYRELATGKTIGQAMESGRAALMVKPDRWLEYGPNGRTIPLEDWFLPQLYQRGSDVALLPDRSQSTITDSDGGSSETRRLFPTGDHVGAFPRPPIYEFHGRARELYHLQRAFHTDRAVLLHAMGGMGKTTLAREAALWLTETGLFPDGACFVSFEQPKTAEQVATVLGTYLEGPEFEQLSQEDQLRRARMLFDTKQILMVWDNFESVLPTFVDETEPIAYSADERQRLLNLFRDLTESAQGTGRMLITCRPEDTGLVRVRRMELSGLTRPDSLYLLAQVLRKRDMSLDDARFSKENLDELLAVLQDHPLSIELVGPHLKTHTPQHIVADFHALLERFSGDAEVERNRSLLASLSFSTSRLSDQAQAALPWLGMFRGGVFETILLQVSEMDPAEWEAVLAELEATALVRVETDIQVGSRSYLRFHPTLPYATHVGSTDSTAESADGVEGRHSQSDSEEAHQRFIATYCALDTAIHQALYGSDVRRGMEVLTREEANFRAAVCWTIEADQFETAATMGDTFRIYLQLSARLRERDQWSAWLAEEATQARFSSAAAAAERERAWSLFTQGHTAKAVELLEALIDRLRHTVTFDPIFQLASTQARLGRIYYTAGYAMRAIPILEEAVQDWETLVRKATNLSQSETIDDLLRSDTKADTHRREVSVTELSNLAAALGDQANALRSAGSFDEALETSERGVEIVRALGHERDTAVGLGQTARILMEQGHYHEADTRYDQALKAAQSVGDKDLEGNLRMHQGLLADNMNQYDHAADLYKQALKLFQGANDDAGVMQTCNQLGRVERYQGRLSEARAWYERSREIAKRRGDKVSLGATAQNIGIVCQQEGEAARQGGDEATAQQRFAEAERSLQESLQLWGELQHQPNEAMSLSQLARLYLLTGELDKAEEYAHRARLTYEALDMKEVVQNYNTLAEIARARGDESQAAEWEAKRDEKIEELNHRAQGDDAAGDGLPTQTVQAVAQLALACVQAGIGGTDLPAEAESIIAQLESPEAGPLQALVPYFRRLATGPAEQTASALASPPADLPEALRPVFAQLLTALSESQQ